MSILHLSSVHQLTHFQGLMSLRNCCCCCVSLRHRYLRQSPNALPFMMFTQSTYQNGQKDLDGFPSSPPIPPESSCPEVFPNSNERSNSTGLNYVANIRKILESRRYPPLLENTPLPLFGEKRAQDRDLESRQSLDRKLGKSSSGLPNPPTTCCMSGCHNCVWIEYVEGLSKYFDDPAIGRDKIREEVNNIEDANIRAVLIMELKFRGLW